MITLVAFDFAQKLEKTISPAEVPQARAAGHYCWADVEGESVASITPLLESLGFPVPLVQEALQPDRTDTFDVFPDCLHFTVREARRVNELLDIRALDLLFNKHGLLIFHPQPAELLTHIRQTYREDFRAFSQSPGFLLYEVTDHLIAGYRKTLLGFSEAVAQIQLKLFGEVDDAIFKQVAALTRDILTFRRILLAAREVLNELTSRRSPFISESSRPTLEVMAGTLERLANDLTTERDVLAETLNLYMGMVSHRTSKLLKRLTMISIIFLPLTFLCGVYGMNFQYMPELHWQYAYAGFWIVVAGIVATLLFVMRWRKWL
jgi:magnesium transporter